MRALRRGLLRSLLLGLCLCGWTLFLHLDQLTRGRLAIPLGSALGALALGFVQLPPALLEDALARRRAWRGRALLTGALAWGLGALGVAAAALQTDYAQGALGAGPEEARRQLMHTLGQPRQLAELLGLGLGLAYPLGVIAFARQWQAGRRDPGANQAALLRIYLPAALLAGPTGLLSGHAIASVCIAVTVVPAVWLACTVGGITYEVLDWVEASAFPRAPEEEEQAS